MAGALPSGQMISKTGRYKGFPIVGSVLVAGAAWLLSTLDVTTPVVLCLYVFGLGVGIGFLMRTLVLAVQNDFPTANVGAATSANNFFREIGATLGSAVVGTIFTKRLTDSLSGNGAGGGVDSLTPAMVHALPQDLRDTVVNAYQHALVPVFGYLVPVFAVGVVLAFLLPEKKLADPERRVLSWFK